MDHACTHWNNTKLKCARNTSLKHCMHGRAHDSQLHTTWQSLMVFLYFKILLCCKSATYSESVLTRDVHISSLKVSMSVVSDTKHTSHLLTYHKSKLYYLYPGDSSVRGCYAMSVDKQLPTFCGIAVPSSSGQQLYNLQVRFVKCLNACLVFKTMNFKNTMFSSTNTDIVHNL